MKGSGTIHDQVAKTMESFAGMQRAEANPQLFSKIMERAAKGGRVVAMVRPGAVWMAAAGIALLIAINTLALTGAGATNSTGAASTTVTSPYQLNNNLDFYSQ